MNDRDRSIINQIRSADERQRRAAMHTLYADPTLRQFAYKAMHTQGLPEAAFKDVFQETMVAFIKNITLGKFREDSQLSTYFYSICKNQCMTLFKKNQPIAPLEDAPPISTNGNEGESSIIASEKRRALKQTLAVTLNALGEKCRKALLLWKRGAESWEIAEELGYKDAAVARTRIHYCRKKLREYVKENAEIRNKLKALR